MAAAVAIIRHFQTFSHLIRRKKNIAILERRLAANKNAFPWNRELRQLFRYNNGQWYTHIIIKHIAIKRFQAETPIPLEETFPKVSKFINL